MGVKICWCEQSGELDDRSKLTTALKAEGIDFYRYNWRHGSADPYANVSSDARLSWSMGRSLLYEHASQTGYDYYIIADDDVLFGKEVDVSIGLIKEYLGRYLPLTACLASPSWHDWTRNKIPRTLKGDVFPYLLADLDVQIFSDFIAENIFPCIFDGGYGTLWYPNICVGIHAPERQLQLNAIPIRNGRENQSGYYGGASHQQLGANILAATIHRETPAWLRMATKIYGLKPTVRLLNAYLSVRKAKSPKPLSDESRQSIIRYLEVTKQTYNNNK